MGRIIESPWRNKKLNFVHTKLRCILHTVAGSELIFIFHPFQIGLEFIWYILVHTHFRVLSELSELGSACVKTI